MDDAGLVGVLVSVAVVLVVGVGGTAAYLYATDYTLKADVEGKQCGPLENVVSIHTRAFGIDHDVKDIPDQECSLLQPGDYVEYRIRSQRTTLYRDGDCLYDSLTGPHCGQGTFPI